MRKIIMVFSVLCVMAACSSAKDGAGPEMRGSQAHVGGIVATENVISNEPVVIPGSHEDLILNVGDRVFFGFDSTVLTTEAQHILTAQARWLNAYPHITITIEGHCDERGTREYNLALGERRAVAARNYLESSGVNPKRISVISYGKERPEILGSNEQAWAQNRRAVVVIN